MILSNRKQRNALVENLRKISDIASPKYRGVVIAKDLTPEQRAIRKEKRNQATKVNNVDAKSSDFRKMDKETRTNNTNVKHLYEEVQYMEIHNPFEETTIVKDS